MTAMLRIASRGDFTSVLVRRASDVPDVLWSRVLSEWGTDGANVNEQITVPVERFLSQLDWLQPACQRYQVGIEWDEETKNLISATIQEEILLDECLRASDYLSPEQVQHKLTTTRFSRELRDFQLRDLGKLLSLPHGANFSVPGAGKTTVTYALYEAERGNARVEKLLVVAPLSAFESWITEAVESFNATVQIHCFDGAAIPPSTEVCLVNYQRLASSYDRIAYWVSSYKTHVVLDEAHRMKRGWLGEWGRSTLNLAYLAVRRDVLTGTPAPQGFRDLEALLDFAWPGQARRILPAAVFERSPAKVSEDVAKAVQPLFVRTTKSDLALPTPDHRVIVVPLDGLQLQIYAALRNQYAGQFSLSRRERVDLARMGEVVMYLLEAATNPQLLTAGSSQFDDLSFKHPPLDVPLNSTLIELLPAYGRYETPRKFIELGKLIKENADSGRKTLIWTNFVRNILVLERMLARYNPAIIHGGIPFDDPKAARSRTSELYRFRNSTDCMVLIANPAATSEGISLHRHCHDAIYVERTFNAGQYLQSVDRIHRLGIDEDTKTRITFLLTEGTIDHVVDQRIREKAKRLGEILADNDISTMSLPDDEDYGPALENQEDLRALFSHLRGESGDSQK